MKTIITTEDVIEENAKKEETGMSQDLIVIHPQNGYSRLISEIIGFLAERTSERLDEITVDMQIAIVEQILRRLELSTNEEAVKMIQMLFIASGFAAEAEYLDILWTIAVHDEKVFDRFIDSLVHTEEFESLSIAGLLGDVQIFLPFRIS